MAVATSLRPSPNEAQEGVPATVFRQSLSASSSRATAVERKGNRFVGHRVSISTSLRATTIIGRPRGKGFGTKCDAGSGGSRSLSRILQALSPTRRASSSVAHSLIYSIPPRKNRLACCVFGFAGAWDDVEDLQDS